MLHLLATVISTLAAALFWTAFIVVVAAELLNQIHDQENQP